MTIKTSLKWSRLWWLLSLDMVAHFRDELWLNELSQSSFEYIRSKLNLRTDLPTYGSDPRPKVYHKLNDFEDMFGSGMLGRLLWWERCVFIHDGADRMAEFIWRMASHCQPGLPSSSPIVTAFQLVKDEYSIEDQRVNDKLQRLQLSSWDRSAIDGNRSSRDEIASSIRAIAGANAFARAWRSTVTTKGPAFLDELFALISHLPASAELQFDPETIPFPSSWEIDLRFQSNLVSGKGDPG